MPAKGARRAGGARVVAAGRDPHARARAAELGADAVADLSGEDADAVAARLAQAAGGRGDWVSASVWGVPAESALRVLSPNGRLVNLGPSAAALARFSSATLRSRVLS